MKWFRKVIKHANFCGKHICNSLLPKFFSGSHFTNVSILTSLKMRAKKKIGEND